MQLTDYHAQYFAHELTKRCSSDKLEKLASTFAGARVDLNPHQVGGGTVCIPLAAVEGGIAG